MSNIDDRLISVGLLDTSGSPVRNIEDLNRQMIWDYKHLVKFHNPANIVHSIRLREDGVPTYVTTYVPMSQWNVKR